MRLVFRILALVALALAVGACAWGLNAPDWRTASREPVGLAPDPAVVQDAVIQVYGARTIGAKGLFGVHTWVAVKPAAATSWTVHEVVGWRLRYADNAVVSHAREPDGRWYGAEPELYADLRGPKAEALIERIEQAVRHYPYASEYRAWPGPNSNTFTAWVARSVPELQLDLPATAIGKDYMGASVFGSAPSGSGFQVSLAGLLGVAASPVEGVELNLLGLNLGLGPSGLKLPLVGLIGRYPAAAQADQAGIEASSLRPQPVE